MPQMRPLFEGGAFLRAAFIWKLDTAKSCIDNGNIISVVNF